MAELWHPCDVCYLQLMYVSEMSVFHSSQDRPLSDRHAVPLWEVSEEPSRDCEKFKGKCCMLGEARDFWQQEVWKGERKSLKSEYQHFFYFNIIIWSLATTAIIVYINSSTRLQRRCPKICLPWKRCSVALPIKSLKQRQWLSLLKSFTTQTSWSLSLPTFKGLTLKWVLK